MWSYYGAKRKLVDYYPAPKHDIVIEPFAGSAAYSVKYWDRDIILIDKNKDIVDIWHYLQRSNSEEIMSLPKLPAGTRINKEDFSCDGQYKLMRFMIVQAAYGGNNIVSKWGALRFEMDRKRVADNVHKCKKWTVIHGSYEDSPNISATWFIDPPYFVGGHKYPMSNKKINYPELAEWVTSRTGQVICCENTNSNWMDFKPMVKHNGVRRITTEAIWTNEPTIYDNEQTKIEF